MPQIPPAPSGRNRPATSTHNLENFEINASTVRRTRLRAGLKPHQLGIHFDGSTGGVADLTRTTGRNRPGLVAEQPHRLDEFVTDFDLHFYPADYKMNLEGEISQRTQRPHETALRYCTALRILIRRHGNMLPAQELYWLHRNILREYLMLARRVARTAPV